MTVLIRSGLWTWSPYGSVLTSHMYTFVRCFISAFHGSQGTPGEKVEMAQQKPIAAAYFFFFFFFFWFLITASRAQIYRWCGLWPPLCIPQLEENQHVIIHVLLPQTAFSLFVSNSPNSPALLEPSSVSSSSTSSFSKNTSCFSLCCGYKQLSSVHCFILLPPVVHGSCIYALLLLNSSPLVSSG